MPDNKYDEFNANNFQTYINIYQNKFQTVWKLYHKITNIQEDNMMPSPLMSTIYLKHSTCKIENIVTRFKLQVNNYKITMVIIIYYSH